MTASTPTSQPTPECSAEPSIRSRGLRTRPVVGQKRIGASKKKTKPEIGPGPGQWLLWELGTNQCHWPHGDGPFTFCGTERTGDPTYCAQHTAILYARRQA